MSIQGVIKDWDSLLPLLGKNQRVSNTLKTENANSFIVPSFEAVQYKWISLNDPLSNQVGFIIRDFDHDDYSYIPSGIPVPWAIIFNKDNARHHKVWRLGDPVYTHPSANTRPQKLLNSIITVLDEELGGDTGYQMGLTKNPFHSDYRVFFPRNGENINSMMDFKFEFSSPKQKVYLPKVSRKAEHIIEEETAKGRNCGVFARARFAAYEYGGNDRRVIEGIVYAAIEEVCPFNPLKYFEANGVAKSITQFMTFRFNRVEKIEVGFNGDDFIEKQNAVNEERKQRQRENALKTAFIKYNKTRAKIEKFLEKNSFVSINDLAKRLNISWDTARKHYNDIQSGTTPYGQAEDELRRMKARENYAKRKDKERKLLAANPRTLSWDEARKRDILIARLRLKKRKNALYRRKDRAMPVFNPKFKNPVLMKTVRTQQMEAVVDVQNQQAIEEAKHDVAVAERQYQKIMAGEDISVNEGVSTQVENTENSENKMEVSGLKLGGLRITFGQKKGMASSYAEDDLDYEDEDVVYEHSTVEPVVVQPSTSDVADAILAKLNDGAGDFVDAFLASRPDIVPHRREGNIIWMNKLIDEEVLADNGKFQIVNIKRHDDLLEGEIYPLVCMLSNPAQKPMSFTYKVDTNQPYGIDDDRHIDYTVPF